MSEVVDDVVRIADLLTVPMAAEISGRSRVQVGNWLASGAYGNPPLQCIRVGRERLILRPELDSFLAAMAGKTDRRTTRFDAGGKADG